MSYHDTYHKLLHCQSKHFQVYLESVPLWVKIERSDLNKYMEFEEEYRKEKGKAWRAWKELEA